MIAAEAPVQRPRNAKLLAVDRAGHVTHHSRAQFVKLLHPGDLVIANDAATLPASLAGTHVPSGRKIEIRLAGRDSLDANEVRRFSAIAFGEGDFRMRTEDRPVPPSMAAGDELRLGPLRAIVLKMRQHPRFFTLEFPHPAREIWAGLSHHGRPIQYSHIQDPLALWDTWTPIAGPPVAFEPPSAGFVLDWELLAAMKRKRVRFSTITHAAGISSTGDAQLDRLLPLDEPYRIPPSTARAVSEVKMLGGRIIAVGTTVVRALEHAAVSTGGLSAGDSLATQRIGPTTTLRIVNAMLSGTHEPGTSHYGLLSAFVDQGTLQRMDAEMNAHGYRTHEFGDSVFVEAGRKAVQSRAAA